MIVLSSAEGTKTSSSEEKTHTVLFITTNWQPSRKKVLLSVSFEIIYFILITEAYLESYKTSMMEIFARTDSSLTH